MKRDWPDEYYENKLSLMRDEGQSIRRFTSKEGTSMNNSAAVDETIKVFTPQEKERARGRYREIAEETQAAVNIDPAEFNTRVRTRIVENDENVRDPFAWVEAAGWVSGYCIEEETVLCLPAPPPPMPPKPVIVQAPVKQERIKVKPKINLSDMYEMPEVILVGGQITKPGPVKHEQLGEESTIDDSGTLRHGERVRTTRRTIQDLDGHKAATELVQRLNNDLRKICATSPFGRVCRVDREPELREFIADARVQAKLHSESELGRYHKVHVHLLPGMITQDSERAAKTLVKEMQELFNTVQNALDDCNVEAIRDSVKRVRALSTVFPASQQKVLETAIAGARQVANTVAREVERKGRTIEDVKTELDMSPIRVARMQFAALPSDDQDDIKIEKLESRRFGETAPVSPINVESVLSSNRFGKAGE